LYHYGTGAVMAVPAHDSRDYRFAKHFNLPIKQVIQPPVEWDFSKQSYDEKNGICINSDFLNGLSVKDAIQKCIEEVENRKIGKRVVNYKLRDAVFGRQRYWGEPIPIYYDENNIPKPVDEKDLPIELPEINKYLPTETGEPPLARATNWKYKGKYEFEKTTMPGWAGSSWYFLRYMNPHNDETFASKEKTSYWNKVDVYVGGSEHATGHLLYARFWTKFLYDLGYIDFDEPFQKLINQGMILGESAILLRLKDPEFTSNDINKKEFFKVYEKDFEIKYDTNGNISSEKLKLDLKKFLEEIDKETKQIFGNAVIIRFKGGQNNFISSEFLISNKITEEEKIFTIIRDVTRKNENSRTFVTYESSEKSPYEGLADRKIHVINYGNLTIYFVIFYSKVYVDVNLVDENDFVSIEKLKAQPASYGEDIKFISDYPDKIKCHREVEKMSKSKMNVINPDDLIEQYGADTFRLYEMFLGPIEQHKPFITNGITGTHNFLKKVWKLFHPNNSFSVSNEPPTTEELKILHKTIIKLREDIDKFSFNTCVSSLMILVNKLTELKCNKREILEPLVIMLSPFAPHIAEYLWTELGHETSVIDAPYPEYKEEYIIENTFNYPISFNGKTRFNLELPLNISKEEVEQLVLSHEQTKKYLKDLKPKKFIFVEKKIVNIVV
jgi:leucyl-tRNA synthetase